MASYDNKHSSYGCGYGSGYSNHGGGRGNGYGGSNNRGNSHKQKELPPEIVPQKVPDDYVDQAERIMRSLMENGKIVSNSKIRKLLSLVSEIYNEENRSTEKELQEKNVVKINLMRVRVAYECGRDNAVKDFVAKTKLLEYLKAFPETART